MRKYMDAIRTYASKHYPEMDDTTMWDIAGLMIRDGADIDQTSTYVEDYVGR